MIKPINYLDHQVGAIYIEGLHDKQGYGYFRAFVEIEVEPDTHKLLHSTSKKGMFAAVANLCKRLDKHYAYTFTGMPSKWQIYLINQKTLQQAPFFSGYLTVAPTKDKSQFWADLCTVTFLDLNDQEIEAYIRKGIVNSVEDSIGQTGFGALHNICQKFHHQGLADTIDNLVLDSLAASFFFPVIGSDGYSE